MAAVASANSVGAGMGRDLGTSSSSKSEASSSSAAPTREFSPRALLEKFFLSRSMSSLGDRDIEALFSDGGLTFRDSKGEIWTVEIMTIAEKTDRLFVKAYKGEAFNGVFLKEVNLPEGHSMIAIKTICQEGTSRPEKKQSVAKSLDARPKFPFEEALAHIMERREFSETPTMRLGDEVKTFIKDCCNMDSESLFAGTPLEEFFFQLSEEDKQTLDAIVSRLPLESRKAVKSLITELGKERHVSPDERQELEEIRAEITQHNRTLDIKTLRLYYKNLFNNFILCGATIMFVSSLYVFLYYQFYPLEEMA